MDAERIRELLAGHRVDELFAQLPLEDVVAAYCRYLARSVAVEGGIEWDDDPDGWAPTLYFELCSPSHPWTDEDEERRRSFIRLAVDAAPNDDVLETIGAGPLEDFVIDDEGRLRWLEEQCTSSARFREALGHVWVWALPPAVFLRVERAAGTPLAWPKHHDVERPLDDRQDGPVSGEVDLGVLLATLDVVREPGVFVVAKLTDGDEPPPCTRVQIREREGLTIVLPREQAVATGLPFVFESAWLTLTMHSSFEAIGLTAAFAARLAEAGIPANVLAGFHHDHILVPVDRADEAIAALRSLRPPA